jgi:uncharacterized protein (TIGR02646 family)
VRTIKKRSPPAELVQWRQQRQAAHNPEALPYNYDAMRRTESVNEAVERGLFQEQGGLCAYTGRRIELLPGPPQSAVFHLEHLKGQKRCRREAGQGILDVGFDTHYQNLVACWPEPNRKEGTPYGAVVKYDWPNFSLDDGDFVSPLRQDCTLRFKFDREGQIERALEGDIPAEQTIKKLALDHAELIALRKAAIQGALSPNNRPLKLSAVEKLRREIDRDERDLDNGGNVKLRAYCFAIRQVLDNEVSKLERLQTQS